MTNSPLTLRRINRLIGQALRAIQLAKSDLQHILLRSTVRWLNRARSSLKIGRDYRFSLKLALDSLREANAA